MWGVMMKSKIETTKIITLTLTEFEARWLRDIMRNPLHGQSINIEDSLDSDMRTIFFDGVKEV